MLKIYLGDLIYDTVDTNYVIPLNIAYIAAYVKEKFNTKVDVKLFKYPLDLEKEIKSSPPDILGLSNYSWNERLNSVFFEMAKRFNPGVVKVLGGPNIRTDYKGVEKYLFDHRLVDFYILFEGEEPFANIVERILGGGGGVKPPKGCAGLVNGQLHLELLDFKKKPRKIDLPSPYLTGILDDFLINPKMIPLFETNRGCPFGCIYCTWGISALSRVRQRPLSVIYEELDYVAAKSAKQVNWIFCDANFGILKRDTKIASKIRQIMDDKKFPINVVLWDSKNTSDRNIEIAKIIKNSSGYIAIQSTDPEVLENCGRGKMDPAHIKKQIGYYKENSFEVATDILIGLPGETAQSHLNSLKEAFDMGFGEIMPYNIRLLPGSQYESEKDREKYKVQTKYRPIFGAYGQHDEHRVFEFEESVRGTKDMSESELESFKIVHWLIYFSWNAGVFKSPLRFAQRHGVNPADVLCQLYSSKSPVLAGLFEKMEKESMEEWFETKEEMIQFYEQQAHFDEMMKDFVKLNSLWVARVYQDANMISVLLDELVDIINNAMEKENPEIFTVWGDLLKVVHKLLCRDILQPEFLDRTMITGDALAYVLNDPGLSKKDMVAVEIYRTKEDSAFCNFHLNPNGEKDFSIQNLTRFIEIGGMKMLTNRIRIA